MFGVSFLKARWSDSAQRSESSGNSGLTGFGSHQTSAQYADEVSAGGCSSSMDCSTAYDGSTARHRSSEQSTRPFSYDGFPSQPAASPSHPWQGSCAEPLSSRGHRYQRIRELSRGGTGFVQEALDTATGQHVAVKFIPRATTGYDPAAVSGELLNQRLCAGHPNIIQLQEVFLTDEYLCLVMDLADGGDLSSTIDRLRLQGQRGMPEADTRWLFQQLLVAVEYCHLLGIANRDVKLDNMLLHNAGPRPLLKLCDFGFSRVEVPSKQCDSSCGTPEYMAPEVLFEEEYNGKVADVWSVGVSLYVLLTGTFPFKRPEDSKANNVVRLQHMFIRIINADFTPVPGLTADCRDLLTRLLNPDPKARMTVTDALRHPWVTRDMPAQLCELNRRLLTSGGPAAFSCVPCAPARGGGGAPSPTAGFAAVASGFLQTPVQLVQLVRQGSRPSGELSELTPRSFAAAPAQLDPFQHGAQREPQELRLADAVSDPLSRLLRFK